MNISIKIFFISGTIGTMEGYFKFPVLVKGNGRDKLSENSLLSFSFRLFVQSDRDCRQICESTKGKRYNERKYFLLLW